MRGSFSHDFFPFTIAEIIMGLYRLTETGARGPEQDEQSFHFVACCCFFGQCRRKGGVACCCPVGPLLPRVCSEENPGTDGGVADKAREIPDAGWAIHPGASMYILPILPILPKILTWKVPFPAIDTRLTLTKLSILPKNPT